MAGKDTLQSFLDQLPTTEKILAKENDKEERKAFQHFEENLRSFIIATESLLQATNQFLKAEDILGESSTKEFSFNIFEDDQVRWTLVLKLSHDGKKWGCWPLLGGVDQSFSVGYGLTIECFFEGGKLYEEIVSLLNENCVRPELITPRLKKIMREHGGLEMTNKAFTIFELQKEVYVFFRKLLLDRVDTRTADYVFTINQKLYYLLKQFIFTHKQLLSNKNAVQSFQCLVFETARDLKDTKSFVKSKKLAQIRENLEEKSRDILTEVNQ